MNASNQRRRYELAFAHTDANRAATINNAPIISGSPDIQIEENKAYRFTPSAVDADGDELIFSIVNKPSWASFDTATGELTGTPTSSDIGTTLAITISAADAYATANLTTFDLEVVESTGLPVDKSAGTKSKSSSGSGSLFWLLMPLLALLGFRSSKR